MVYTPGPKVFDSSRSFVYTNTEDLGLAAPERRLASPPAQPPGAAGFAAPAQGSSYPFP